MKMDVIDYEIFGDDTQFVEIELDPNEAAIGEAGAMMMMDDGIDMDTIFGDASEQQQSGFLPKLFSAGKRLVTGESLFTTVFNNRSSGKRKISFAAPYPGKIIPLNLSELGNEFICQKDAFLCAARGVCLDIAFQKKLSTALFGGEGFIMQRLRGDGIAFVHAGGMLSEKKLAPNQIIKIDTGTLVGMEPSVSFDIQYVGKLKTAVFGGEGLFLGTLRGPGRVWIQSLPVSRLAGRILAYATTERRGEGSMLGGIGNMLDGDGF